MTIREEAAPTWGLVTVPRRNRPKPVSGWYRVVAHVPAAERYMSLTLDAPDIAALAMPGQFLMLTAARKGERTPALPRPMAVYSTSVESGLVTVLFGVVGDGTRVLQSFEPGEQMYVVGPLGQPFTFQPTERRVLLLGRGIGTCSLTTICEFEWPQPLEVIAVTSARTRRTVVGGDFYRTHNASAVYEVTDEDGTSSPEGLFQTLTAAYDDRPADVIVTCGSERLTRLAERLASRWSARVQVSIEAHMACGLGYCHGCATGARSEGAESPLICNDGPVFSWEPASDPVR